MKVAQSYLTLCDPVHGILQARILEWVAFPFSRGSFQPRDQPRSPALQAVSLPAEPQGKPKSTGVGSLSLLQWIFLTQDLNWGLLHCQKKQWHPTPVLLPGKSHGRRSWKAAVHGVAEGQTRRSNFTFTFHFHALEKEMATHSSVLPWRIPGAGEPGGLSSMGSHRVGHD